tara:strand:+ start:3187 stop:3933 length:747 start_codon:yes stop_codon:yes gene_type:complete
MTKRVLIIGESCKDIFNYGKCDRLCPDAPVPVFNGVNTVETDGMAMNVAHNMGALGVTADIITNDNWQNSKKSRYIDNKTNQMLLRIDENDEVLQPLDAFALNEETIRKFDAIIISDYCKGFLTEKSIKQISLLNRNVFLDTKRLLGPWCSDIEFIKINYYEHGRTKHLLNEDIYDKLIITLGSGGCKYRDEVFPVPKVEIKDSSGGGDTFIAGLVAKYLETNDIREAIKFANECATKVVQKRGVSVV